VPRFAAFDTSNLRNASGAARLPWLGRSVTLLRIDATGVVEQAKTDAEKRSLLDTSTSTDLVLVAWPSQWSQDIHVVDDLRRRSGGIRRPGQVGVTRTVRRGERRGGRDKRRCFLAPVLASPSLLWQSRSIAAFQR
jgi:hypothetical protein